MIDIKSDHEEIAKYIVRAIADDGTHAVSQHALRQHFANPYRLHEYDFALKLLKDFDVIRHNDNGRLTPGNLFYTYTNLKGLYKPRIDWKFYIATLIAVFGTASAFYFSYTDQQKSTTIRELEKANSDVKAENDSLVKRLNYFEDIRTQKLVDKTDTALQKK